MGHPPLRVFIEICNDLSPFEKNIPKSSRSIGSSGFISVPSNTKLSASYISNPNNGFPKNPGSFVLNLINPTVRALLPGTNLDTFPLFAAVIIVGNSLEFCSFK